MSTPPMPHSTVSQRGVLSRAPGAANFPSRPMMSPAMINPMISIANSSDRPTGARGPGTVPGVPPVHEEAPYPRGALLMRRSPNGEITVSVGVGDPGHVSRDFL